MKVHNSLYKLIINKKIYIYLISALIIGVFIMLIPKFIKDYTADNDYSMPYSVKSDKALSYKNDKSYELSEILSKITGVGDTEVFINYSENKSDNSNGGIEGVIIVAEGGGRADIELMIKNVVSNTFDIPIHKINVLRMTEYVRSS